MNPIDELEVENDLADDNISSRDEFVIRRDKISSLKLGKNHHIDFDKNIGLHFDSVLSRCRRRKSYDFDFHKTFEVQNFMF